MKNFKILSVLVLFFVGLFFVGCEKDWNEKPATQGDTKVEVEFGIINPFELKTGDVDGFDIECDQTIATHAQIVINGQTYTPELIIIGDKMYTEVIKFEKGVYEVESFMLINGDDIISATPAEGSEFAIYVDKPVPFEFETLAFDKTEVSVEVLCYNEAQYENFGFNWLNIGQVEVHEIPFFGDLCIDPDVNYTGSGYDYHFDPLHDNYPIDAPAIFEIRTFVDWGNGDGWEDLKVFSNLDENGEFIPNSPVIAEYFTHSSGVIDFRFELWGWDLIEDDNGGIWDYIHFDTWEFDSENPPETNEFGVIDFYIGYCVYGSNPETTYPPSNGNPPNLIGSDETAWGGNTLGGGASWWFYFKAEDALTTYGGTPMPIYAGQNLIEGASVRIEQVGEQFDMIIDLGQNMILQDGHETVKVQRYLYQEIPESRPAPGQFTTYKGNQLVIPGISWTTSGHYYAVHLDVIVLD